MIKIEFKTTFARGWQIGGIDIILNERSDEIKIKQDKQVQMKFFQLRK